ncbi:MAG: hypothetical protein JRN21_09725 [Nitrososphaerota archaeon]|nr:hypothetical protein [Nitrososphaerota archaeon]
MAQHKKLEEVLKSVDNVIVYRWKTRNVPWLDNTTIDVLSIRAVLLDPKKDEAVLEAASKLGLAFDESEWIDDVELARIRNHALPGQIG